MKKSKPGFLDLSLEPSWEITRFSGDKKEKFIIRRKPIMQDLLKFLVKEVGPPCKAFNPSCIACDVWLSFAKIDSVLED